MIKQVDHFCCGPDVYKDLTLPETEADLSNLDHPVFMLNIFDMHRPRFLKEKLKFKDSQHPHGYVCHLLRLGQI